MARWSGWGHWLEDRSATAKMRVKGYAGADFAGIQFKVADFGRQAFAFRPIADPARGRATIGFVDAKSNFYPSCLFVPTATMPIETNYNNLYDYSSD